MALKQEEKKKLKQQRENYMKTKAYKEYRRQTNNSIKYYRYTSTKQCKEVRRKLKMFYDRGRKNKIRKIKYKSRREHK